MNTPTTARATFDLGQLVPGWSGPRIEVHRAPIERGIAQLQRALAGRPAALIISVTRFGFDDMWGGVEAIEPVADPKDAPGRATDIVEQHERELLAANPGWIVLTRKAHAAEVLPATGSVVPGNFPRQLLGVKVGNTEIYESAYIRAALVEADGGDLADRLLGLTGMQGDLVDYVQGLGEAAKAP